MTSTILCILGGICIGAATGPRFWQLCMAVLGMVLFFFGITQ